MQNPSVGTPRRGHPGMHPANQLGSRAKCFHGKSSRCSQVFPPLQFDQAYKCPAGTRGGFVWATARTPVIWQALAHLVGVVSEYE